MTAASSLEHMLAIAALDGRRITPGARRMATFSLFDWMSVALAGAGQPLSRIIRGLVEEEAGAEVATVVGGRRRVPARAAALANGAISHALDYDDTHFAHLGHLSVGIFPAALAAAEEVDATAGEVRDAFLLGAEISCRFGMVLGGEHYRRGFHQTATAGAFGATAAAGRIYGLTPAQMRHALNLVSTRASGLTSQFGSMGKPFNAGISASNGVEAAALARRGFLSCDDGVGSPQGFAATHAGAADHLTPWQTPPPERFVFEDIRYKLHACCHGTHAMIEALRHARRTQGLKAAAVRRIEVRTHPRWLQVCDIKRPRSGLEVKFSYVFLAAMVLSGLDTSSEKAYGDGLCDDPALRAAAERVVVAGDERLSDTAAELIVDLTGGGRMHCAHDLAHRIPDAALELSLRAKAEALLGGGVAAELWDAMRALDTLPARDLGKLLARRA